MAIMDAIANWIDTIGPSVRGRSIANLPVNDLMVKFLRHLNFGPYLLDFRTACNRKLPIVFLIARHDSAVSACRLWLAP
jgi:hypothetical protein